LMLFWQQSLKAVDMLAELDKSNLSLNF
jgi:hypothetical protein